jgi:type II secretory pathway pseudopilin PulG
MVVLLILGILVSLAVGIGVLVFGSAAEKQTKATMRVVLSAVYAYQEAAGAFPPDVDPNKPTDSNKYSVSGRTLKLFLTGTGQGMSATSPGVPAAVEKLRSLSGDAFGSADGGFADGWGTGIRYRPAGGFGGKPLLVSAGPDRLFGEAYQESTTPPVLVIVGDPNQRKDNIYYDGE